jgi:hypothetical protein
VIWALLASLAIVAIYLRQDGIAECNDGNRYVSRKPQPYPFHRRFHYWPKRALQVVTILSLVGLGIAMPSWKGAVLLLSLPGAWFCATHPTTVDAPSMLLAVGSSLLEPAHPWAAVLASIASGFIHERGPVFAALYAGSPLLLVGLAGVQWWAKKAAPDRDPLVGQGFVKSLALHRPYNELLDWRLNVLSLRGLPFLAAFYGVSPLAWGMLALAWLSRVVGTDLGRYMFWAAPMLVRELPDVPAWLVMAHALSFRRMA